MTQTDIANLALAKIGETLIADIGDTGDKASRLASLHYEPTLRELLRAHFWGFALGCVEVPKTLAGTSVKITGNLSNESNEMVVFPDLPLTEVAYGRPYFALGDYRLGFDIAQDRWELFDDGYSPYPLFISADFVPSPELAVWSASSPGVGTPTVALSVVSAADLNGWGASFTLPADFIKLRRVLTEDGGRIDKFDFRRINGGRCLVAGDHESIILDYVQFVDEPDDYDPLFVEALATLLASKLARAITGSEANEGALRQLYEINALPAARMADAHDSQSNENRPMDEFLAGGLLTPRGNFLTDLDD